MERLYESMVEKGEPINSIKKQLFNVYGRNTNLEKLLKLKEVCIVLGDFFFFFLLLSSLFSSFLSVEM